MIRFSVRTKLAALLSVMSLLLVVSILWAVKANFDKGFQEYLNEAAQRNLSALAANVSRHAENSDDWQGFISDPRQWNRLFREYRQRQMGDESLPPPRHPGPAGALAPPHAGHAPFTRAGLPRPGMLPPPHPGGRPVWVLDHNQQVIYGPPLAESDAQHLLRIPITKAGNPVAYVATRKIRVHDNASDKIFAEQQHRLFLWIAVIAVLFSILVSLPVSRYLVTPIQTLSTAMRVLMQRQYDKRVPVTSQDELGELAQAFNVMAQTLQEHDSQQRQWLADISHELRTPLGVLKGELEAVQDGILPLDQTIVVSLLEEVVQLSRLVDDLHQLAVTQASRLRYHIEPTNLSELIARLNPRLENLMSSARLDYQVRLPSQSIWIEGDGQRLEQLIMNLAQNSVRYTHPEGCVRLTVDVAKNVSLCWEDSAPGVDEEDMAHLFDRFYRVEKSRQRALGGSGLGLSIVANIVEAHQATLSAHPSELGGLLIKIEFPCGVCRQ